MKYLTLLLDYQLSDSYMQTETPSQSEYHENYLPLKKQVNSWNVEQVRNLWKFHSVRSPLSIQQAYYNCINDMSHKRDKHV